MNSLKISICFLAIFFTTQLFSQSKTANKIQYNVRETMHQTRYTSDLKYKLNFFINDEYVDDPYDKKFFQNHFGNSKKALNLSLNYLDLNKKANRTKTKGIIISGVLSLASLGSIFLLDNASKTTRYTVAGVGLASAFTASIVLTSRHHKLKEEAYLNLENALSAYREENPAAYLKVEEESTDNESDTETNDTQNEQKNTEMASVNIDDDRKVSIKTENLKQIAYKAIHINFFDGTYSGTKKQYSPGLDFMYMKNGFFLNGNFKIHIYDTNRLFTKKEYNYNHSPFDVTFDPEAYPINLSLPYNVSITSVIPFKSFVKEGPIMTKMKRFGNTQLMYKSTTSILNSWGLQLSADMDKSVQTTGLNFDSEHVFPESTNNLNLAINNPAFLRRSINVSGGLSYSMFTAYELRPNDKALDESYKVVNWSRIYAIAKYNLNSSFEDMYYKGITPVLFDNIEETKIGFAVGLEGAYLNKNKGFNFGAELGLNPHISEGGFKDLYGRLKIGFSLGWF